MARPARGDIWRIVPDAVLTPPAVAVRPAVLAANGNTEEAGTLLREIRLDDLVAEERALLDETLR